MNMWFSYCPCSQISSRNICSSDFLSLVPAWTPQHQLKNKLWAHLTVRPYFLVCCLFAQSCDLTVDDISHLPQLPAEPPRIPDIAAGSLPTQPEIKLHQKNGIAGILRHWIQRRIHIHTQAERKRRIHPGSTLHRWQIASLQIPIALSSFSTFSAPNSVASIRCRWPL